MAGLLPRATSLLTPAILGDGDAQVQRMSSSLASLVYASRTAPAGVSPAQVIDSSRLPLIRDAQGRVAVSVTARDVGRLTPELQRLGFQVTASLPALHLVEGFLPLASILDATTLAASGLLGLSAIARPQTGAGAVTSQADFVLEADRVRNTLPAGLTGAGVKVGVISDSFNRLGGYAAGVASGDLPAGVLNYLEGPAGSSDEGRGMAELVHDLAPGSPLAFGSAFYGQAQFGQLIRDLANPAVFGASIITDDIFYFEEPLFQDGPIAQAINDVVANRDVAYFALAGNLGTQAYESTSPSFGADPTYGSGFLDFNPGAGVDTRQRITLGAGQVVYLNLQWDQPFYTVDGVTTDLDFYLIDPATGAIVASSAADNPAIQTPSELLAFQNTTGATRSYDLLVYNFSGPNPGRVKWVNYGANNYGAITVVDFPTNSATANPHASAAGLSVGAAPFFDQLNPESYTSTGPNTILFSPNGTRLAAPEIRATPDVTSIDGTDTTFFGSDFDGDGRPNFFGTSAAAPHAAAVAALLRQYRPGFTAQQVYDRLTSTADDIVSSGIGRDVRTGYGLINAFDAIFGDPTAASPSVLDGFESRALDVHWETYNDGASRTIVTSTGGPASGSYHLVMDSSLGFFSGLGESVLHVNLAGRKGVQLAFRQKESGDGDQPMPSSFNGRVDADGVAFSVDGVNWYRLISLTGADSTSTYQARTFDLSGIAAGLGLTLGADVRIKFQHFDTTGGFAFDDVKVTAISQATALVVDDGTAQRSRIRSITLDVAGTLATVPASAFTLTRTTDGVIVPVVPSFVVRGDGTTRIVLTFQASALQGGSLPDGRYSLRIDGAAILDDAGNPIDAALNGVRGSVRTLAFHRFFGDSNGDGQVDAVDFLAFRAAALGVDPTSPSASIFDGDGDGDIDLADQTAFTANFRKRRLS
ncbi:S8 family peptidase [Planctomyces sp. SH-PL62]|uniref:S8 family peptidase n=1 Tax=Planctomyces sp. SH-PL62 TaxID=1636152 RepID=UPI00078BEA5F|nr:S8 family serine peptidase [Planctomyces sp. SH-PL62]AMV36725.1 Bacillopeptidase F precursor [Planctomyces sp. SH-PL62]